MPADVKYIDPTYMIRARPCNAADHILCTILGQNAVCIHILLHKPFISYIKPTLCQECALIHNDLGLGNKRGP